MSEKLNKQVLETLKQSLNGELYYDLKMRSLYATDASVYRMLPTAVAIPRNEEDIIKLVQFAQQNKIGLIPRAAGTSLAGQCVGDGIVVDTSKYFTKILDFNKEQRWVKVQPGVIRDELNLYLRTFGLIFGPNTSTANRATIGGMVGNNSCGSTSIVSGSTRDHVLALKTILSDGSVAVFANMDKEQLKNQKSQNNLEGKIVSQTLELLQNPKVQEEIKSEFPHESIHRRNTGYAIDELLYLNPINEKGKPFNMCKLLCGSEGTLAFTTEITLNVDPLPPPCKVMVVPHFRSIGDCLEAVTVAMKYYPEACEMMDKLVMDCTKGHREFQKYRFFLKEDPAAVLMVEFAADDMESAELLAAEFILDLQEVGLGYAFPILEGVDMKQVWDLRKAGLGLLANVPGDNKAVAVIEDTAVRVQDLSKYIAEFTKIMDKYGQKAVYYAHAGAGELHLRPLLNLKRKDDRVLFRSIAEDTAKLVKKYRGSLSGEHGDGIVRAEFIPLMVGEKNYEYLKTIKKIFDPNNILNPGKIVHAAPMDESLRYEENQRTEHIDTLLNFSETQGILRAAEQCNGSGDCRKLPLSDGGMCPSYQATRDEKDTTRARANILREFLTNSDKQNKFDHQEIYDVMDLCLSCKACASECPSNVDMAGLKAEFLYQYYKTNGVPVRARAIANIGKLNRLGSNFRPLSNLFLKLSPTSTMIKKTLGIASKRSLPTLSKTTLERWAKKNLRKMNNRIRNQKGEVYLFIDEFTNYNDADIGIVGAKLLHKLGYRINYIPHAESGRAYISKGLLDEAQEMAKANVETFRGVINEHHPLIGIEPSAILSFRDEYPRMVDKVDIEYAKIVGDSAMMIEEFLMKEFKKGKIDRNLFTTSAKKIKLHGHCHQKALASVDPSAYILSFPKNYSVEIIPSGCCGMAGSFGYEEEHYEVSMKVGEMVLFPAVREARDYEIAAPGTSCRHQIKDGTDRHAKHPIEILYEALN